MAALPVSLLLVVSLWAPATALPAQGEVRKLEREFQRLSALAEGTVGVAAVHLESGQSAWLHADQAFPMASTYKVPIAVQWLRRVQAGETSLDAEIEIREGDLHPGSGKLAQSFEAPAIRRGAREMFEQMLLISDNSATDIMLREAGGPAAVTACMKEVGADGIRVDRSTLRLIADWLGIEELPPEREVDPATFQRLYSAVTAEERSAAGLRFDDDPRDTATPRAMASLLCKLWRDELLDPERCALLRGVMGRCETGADRLLGRLPPGTPVAHKTGTIGGTTNDIGVVTLPNAAGHLVMVVFVKQSQVTVPERERAIAELCRAAHDFFLFEHTDSDG